MKNPRPYPAADPGPGLSWVPFCLCVGAIVAYLIFCGGC